MAVYIVILFLYATQVKPKSSLMHCQKTKLKIFKFTEMIQIPFLTKVPFAIYKYYHQVFLYCKNNHHLS